MYKFKTINERVLANKLLTSIQPHNGLLLADVGRYSPKIIPFIKQEIETNQKSVISYLKHSKQLHNHYISTQLPVEYLYSIVLADGVGQFLPGDLVYTTKRVSTPLALTTKEYLPNLVNQVDTDETEDGEGSSICFVVGFYNDFDIVAKLDESFIRELL